MVFPVRANTESLKRAADSRICKNKSVMRAAQHNAVRHAHDVLALSQNDLAVDRIAVDPLREHMGKGRGDNVLTSHHVPLDLRGGLGGNDQNISVLRGIAVRDPAGQIDLVR